MDENLKQRYQVHPKVVDALARVVHLLGKQELALCGHLESSDASHNRGNFLILLHEIGHYYPLLKNYLEDSLRKDVKNLGPKSQNELIDIIGKKLIQRIIIEEMTEAGVHPISADKVTTCNNEILSICLRYVNNDNEICEVFMDFLELERITGKAIGNAVIKFYNDISVEIAECRGQYYDGAANMKSHKKGAASYVLKESPEAIVTHCCIHNLNLSLASSCKHLKIDSILKIYKAISIFFNSSPKGEGLSGYIVRSAVSELKNVKCW